MLYESVIEVDERLQLISNKKDLKDTDVKGISGDFIRVAKALDVNDLRKKLKVQSS